MAAANARDASPAAIDERPRGAGLSAAGRGPGGGARGDAAVESKWIRVTGRPALPFVDLAAAYHPAIRSKPGDLWKRLRAYCRVALPAKRHENRRAPVVSPRAIRVAIHYVWDTPTPGDLRRRRPRASGEARRRILERFRQHERRWGPGDVEGVWMTLRRDITMGESVSLDSADYRVAELDYRTGANVPGVVRQILKWEWEKLGQKRVRYRLPRAGVELRGSRPVLTVDSYHHSFYEADDPDGGAARGRRVTTPPLAYFSADLWRRYRIVDNHRGFEPWEAA